MQRIFCLDSFLVLDKSGMSFDSAIVATARDQMATGKKQGLYTGPRGGDGKAAAGSINSFFKAAQTKKCKICGGPTVGAGGGSSSCCGSPECTALLGAAKSSRESAMQAADARLAACRQACATCFLGGATGPSGDSDSDGDVDLAGCENAYCIIPFALHHAAGERRVLLKELADW
eukprot:SAG22_NODE_333_length_12162_cov_11.415237_4_plen_175_part_00